MVSENFFTQKKIISIIRDFFNNQNFKEVTVPILSKAIPIEPNIYPFKINNYYLATSPERELKLLLAKGIGDCFTISPAFRDLEQTGPLHKSEFLMLEWYRKNSNYKDIMKDLEKLIIYIKKNLNNEPLKLPSNFQILSLGNLFKKHLNIDLREIILNEIKLFEVAKQKNYQTKNATWQQLFDQILVNGIEPHLPKEPFFLTDYPAKVSPLCQPQKGKPYLAERFEFYLNGIEIANGNTENTNSQSIRKVFEKENLTRHQPMDEEFLKALDVLKASNKNYAGAGLGLDRLTMVFNHIDNIHNII